MMLTNSETLITVRKAQRISFTERADSASCCLQVNCKAPVLHAERVLAHDLQQHARNEKPKLSERRSATNPPALSPSRFAQNRTLACRDNWSDENPMRAKSQVTQRKAQKHQKPRTESRRIMSNGAI